MYSKIAFRKRGVPDDFYITQDDLVDMGDNEYVKIKRGPSEKELPREVRVLYLDYDGDYIQGAQYTRRLTGSADGTVTAEIPLVTTADHAKQISETNLYLSWVARAQYEFMTTQAWALVEPTDCGYLEVDGYVHTIRISKKTENSDGTITFEATADDATLYTAGERSVPVPPSRQQATTVGCLPIMVDIPPLRYTGTELGCGAWFYAQPESSGAFTGSTLMVSRDDGATWEVASSSIAEPTFGFTLSMIGDGMSGAGFIPDEESELTVYIERGSLVDTDFDGLMQLTNLALIGDEVVAFRDVQPMSGGQYRLTGFLRGLLGTEYAMSTHTDQERFVMLDDAVQFVPLTYDDIDTEIRIACVRPSEFAGDRPWSTFAWTGENIKPRAPMKIDAGKDGSGDWTINWTPRTRVPSTIVDSTEITAPEDVSPTYRIRIYTTDFATLKRTLWSNTASVSYTAAQQSTDFGGPVTQAGVEVCQEGYWGSPNIVGRAGRSLVEV